MSVLGIIQARVNSVRLPGKVVKPLNGRPALYRIMRRALRCGMLDKVYLATSVNSENDALADIAAECGCGVYRGDEDDVLSRFVSIIEKERPEIVVRINADNFALSPEVVEHGIKELVEKGYDVCSSFIDNTYPFGSGAETSTADCILKLDRDTRGKDKKYREHIYLYAYKNPKAYKVGSLRAPEALRRPEIDISVDTEEGYETMKRIYGLFQGREELFTLSDIISVWDSVRRP